MATTIKLKNGSGAPLAGDLVQGEPAFDLTNKRLYTEDSGGTVIEVGTNPTSLTTGTFTSTGIDDNATSTAITIDASENTFFSSANTHAASVNVASFANTTTGEPVAIAFGAVADNGGGGNEGGIYFDAGATGSAADNQLQFNADHQSSITPDMVITGSGNVGIGTTSPTQPLDISASMASAGDGPVVQVTETSGGARNGIHYTSTATTNSAVDLLKIEDAVGARFIVKGGGNVGIGTTTPDNKFHVVSGSAGEVAQFTGEIEARGLSIRSETNTDASAHVVFNSQSGGSKGMFTFETDGTERMRIDSSGNVGIGTSSPSNTLTVNKDTGSTPTVYINNSGADATDGPALKVQASGRGAGIADVSVFSVHNISDEIFTVRNDGNVGIGETTPSARLDVAGSDTVGIVYDGSANAYIRADANTGSQAGFSLAINGVQQGVLTYDATDEFKITSPTSLRFVTNLAERMRIDSSGNLLVGTTALSGNGGRIEAKQNNASSWSILGENTTASPFGVKAQFSNAAPNGTNNYFFMGQDTVGNKFLVYSNGGIANFSANDANLSDERAKKDIAVSGNYLDKLCAIPVKNFRYNHDEADGKHHLGVIAQDVEAVAPELVNKESWEIDGEMMDTVYNTDLMFAMMKSIQEQQEQINELKAEVAALKGA